MDTENMKNVPDQDRVIALLISLLEDQYNKDITYHTEENVETA